MWSFLSQILQMILTFNNYRLNGLFSVLEKIFHEKVENTSRVAKLYVPIDPLLEKLVRLLFATSQLQFCAVSAKKNF